MRPNQQVISFKDKRVVIIAASLIALIALGFFSYRDLLTQPLYSDQYAGGITITPVTYLMTQFSVILKYIQLLILPVNQVLDYNYKLVTSFADPRAWACLLVLLGLVALGIYFLKKHRIISFGIFWFFLTLSIESSIIPIHDLIFEHRTYLPSFGFFLLFVYVIYTLTWKNLKTVGISIVALVIIVNSVLTFMRNMDWKDEITLTTDSISKSPGKARPYNNRGDALVDLDRMEEAISDFNKAIEIHPEYFMAYYNRGNMFQKQKKYEQALADYTTAIRHRPNFDQAFNNRGSVYKELNRLEEALQDYDKAITLNPKYHMAYNNRGTVYILQKQYDRAIEDLTTAITLKPDFAEAYGNLGVSKIQLGNPAGCEDLKHAANLGFAPAGEYFRQRCSPK